MKHPTITWSKQLFCASVLFSLIVCPLFAEEHPKIDTADGWKSLLSKDLSAWKSLGKWAVDEKGVLAREKGGDIWTAEQYGDFILDLEFKVKEKANSGVAIRVSPAPTKKKRAWYFDGALEVQILAPNNHKKPDKHDCGSMYDLVEASRDVQKKVGQWNRYTIIAKGSKIKVIFNGEKVVDMDLDNWPEAHKNPDGTKNKYRKAMKDFPRKGHILLQYHGHPTWFRNVYIKKLD